jgi:O-acetylserine/cysteine efflux transporter
VTPRDRAALVLVTLIWGLNFVVIDWGMTGVPPLVFAALRFSLVMIPALWLPRPAVPFRYVAAVGVFMSLGQFGLLYVSLDLGMPPGLASLVLQAQVVFTVAVAAVALKERPLPLQLAGVVVGSAGLVLIGWTRGQSGLGWAAVATCVLAALSWAVGNVVARAAGVRAGLSLTVWSAVVVPLPLLALALLVDGPAAVADGLSALGPRALVSTAYTVVLASLVGYGVFTTMLARYPSAVVVPWILLVPVFGMSSAWLLTGERPDPTELVGGLVLLAGVLLAGRARPRPAQSSSTAERPASRRATGTRNGEQET